MKKLLVLAVLACLTATANAMDADRLREKLKSCAEGTDTELAACVRKLAQQLDDPTPPDNADGLAAQFDRQWALDDDKLDGKKNCLRELCAYRPSYIGVRHSYEPNAWPSSPTPEHALSAPISHMQNEGKFQISFKSLVLDFPTTKLQVWTGYTQQSHWQIFDNGNSRPFRETDYEPELYFNYKVDRAALRMLGLGFVHQSNGQSNPLSRSWNRTYLQAGFAHQHWTLLLKTWHRWHENASDDDNPGIENYVGRAEATMSWASNSAKGLLASLRLRHSLNPYASHGSAQLDLSWGISDSRLRPYVQIFSGYGESLLDYNHSQTTIGGGIAILDW